MDNYILKCTFILLLSPLYLFILSSNIIFWFIFNLFLNIIVRITLIFTIYLLIVILWLLRFNLEYILLLLVTAGWLLFLYISKLSLYMSLSSDLCGLCYSGGRWVLMMMADRIRSSISNILCCSCSWLILLLVTDLLI